MKRKGRPPKANPMTGAQRVARHRARQAIREAEVLREILRSVTLKDTGNSN